MIKIKTNKIKEAEFDDETKNVIENSRQQFRNGECTVCSTDEELKAYFGSLRYSYRACNQYERALQE